MTKKRVIWYEGLFLRPQHFQQLERSFDWRLDVRSRSGQAFQWGFSRLQIDAEALKFGRIAIQSAQGLLRDGTPFSIPDEYPAPPPLDLPSQVRDSVIYLALPAERAGMPDFALEDGSSSVLARWVAQDASLQDNVLYPKEHAECGTDADAKLGRLNLRLLYAELQKVPEGFSCLGIVRVVEKHSNGQVVLDPKYIAPALEITAQQALVDYLTEVRNLVRHRADALAGRLTQASQNDFGQVQELLALQVANRVEPLLTHLLARPTLHPEALYAQLLLIAGEFATFMDQRKRRARQHAPYQHEDLRGSFEPVMADLRELLADLIDPRAVRIDLRDHGRSVFSGLVAEIELLRTAKFVLAVKAHVDGESLRQRLPRELKIGPLDKIKEISNLALSGIAPRPLPMAPPRMPYFADYVYFELDRQSEFWKNLEANRTIVLHFSGDFPGLKLEMWALRP